VAAVCRPRVGGAGDVATQLREARRTEPRRDAATAVATGVTQHAGGPPVGDRGGRPAGGAQPSGTPRVIVTAAPQGGQQWRWRGGTARGGDRSPATPHGSGRWRWRGGTARSGSRGGGRRVGTVPPASRRGLVGRTTRRPLPDGVGK